MIHTLNYPPFSLAKKGLIMLVDVKKRKEIIQARCRCCPSPPLALCWIGTIPGRFSSLLILIKYFVLFYITHIAHAHTHRREEKRPGIIPIQHKARGGEGRRQHRACIISFLFVTPTNTLRPILAREKGG